MKFGDLQPGQEFVIRGRKTPIGFIALEDGCAYYGLDKDVPVTNVKDPMFAGFNPGMLFSKRTKVAVMASDWCEKRNIPADTFNIITALSSMGFLDIQAIEDAQKNGLNVF